VKKDGLGVGFEFGCGVCDCWVQISLVVGMGKPFVVGLLVGL
jgi:hypothetical protein